MPKEARTELIRALQAKRGGRLLIAYVTSTRSGHEIQMADDVIRIFYDHLEAGREQAKKGVDILIHSNGGSGTVPWRIVSLVREYTDNFAVLVPHHAFSAATLLALGANEIVMHRAGCLGPIDPSVTSPFNPHHPQAPGAFLPISVEDVSAYVKFVKEEVGITHEDELVRALVALTDKIHPLALGNVQRFQQQARLMAKKLLRTHIPQDGEEHRIGKIIDHLKSNLFFHGHPISREEAVKDLGLLNVKKAGDDLEDSMWALFAAYEVELKLREPFNAMHELEVRRPAAPAPQVVSTQDILAQIGVLAQQGVGIGAPGQPETGLSPGQMVELATAMLPHLRGAQTPTQRSIEIDGIPGAYVQSEALAHVFRTDLTLERMTVATPGGPTAGLKQEVRWQRWEEDT